MTLSDRDRLFAAGCLVRGLADDRKLAAAILSIPWSKHQTLIEQLIDFGWVDAAEIPTFDEGIRIAVQASGGDHATALHLLANEQTRRAESTMTLDVVRRALLENEPGAHSDSIRRSEVGFRLIRVIGEGGLGKVWLAHDERLERDVAVKELRADRARIPELRERFLREAKISAQLQHPNIAAFYFVGEGDVDRQLFIAMELVAGRTLRQVIREERQNWGDPDARRRYLREQLSNLVKVCDGVAYAHSRGIIHRDLKPANIMIGQFGEVFVLDWGLAKQVKSLPPALGGGQESLAPRINVSTPFDPFSLTGPGKVLGSLPYMTPEQAFGDNESVGPATDIYCLGGILFAILTGRTPHVAAEGMTALEFANSVATSPTPVASEIDPEVPPALNAICSKAMAREPSRRHPSVASLQEDIHAWLAGERVSCYREPASQCVARWLIERPNVVRPLLALFVGMTVIVSTVMFFSVIEYQARSDRAMHNLTAGADLIVGRISDQADSLRRSSLLMADTINALTSEQPAGGAPTVSIERMLQEYIDHHPHVIAVAVFAAKEPTLLASITHAPPSAALADFVAAPPPIRKAGTADLALVELPAPDGTSPTYVLRCRARGEHFPPGIDPETGVRVVVDLDFGRHLQAIVEPLMKEIGITVYVADERGEIFLYGSSLDVAQAKIGRFGTCATIDPDVDRFMRRSESAEVAVFISAVHDRDIFACRKLAWNPPSQTPFLGIVLSVSRRQFIAVPLHTTLWMAVAVASVLAVAAVFVLLFFRAIVRLAGRS